MNKKGALILEYVWLGLAILSAMSGIIKFYFSGLNNSYVFFIITLISAFMYMFRRSMRKFQQDNK